MKKIFVYGTLKNGYPLNSWLEREELLDPDYITHEAHYDLYDLGGAPGMKWVGDGGYQIRGEVWSMNDLTENNLGLVEGSAYKLRHLPPDPNLHFFEFQYLGKFIPPIGHRLKEWTWSSYRSIETESERGLSRLT